MPASLGLHPGLVTGERLTAEEFLRRWEALPDLKNAELIEGIGHVSSPLSLEHACRDRRINWWLTHYMDAAPGCDARINARWLMLDRVPQPVAAFWADDGAKMPAALDLGLATPEHQSFVAQLAAVARS